MDMVEEAYMGIPVFLTCENCGKHWSMKDVKEVAPKFDPKRGQTLPFCTCEDEVDGFVTTVMRLADLDQENKDSIKL